MGITLVVDALAAAGRDADGSVADANVVGLALLLAVSFLPGREEICDLQLKVLHTV